MNNDFIELDPPAHVGKKLRLKISGLPVARLAFALVILFLFLGELFFRADAVQARLSARHFGSRHRQLEIQLARLDHLVEQEGPVDCIFLGNSMTWLGVDPQAVMDEFAERTGQRLRCFNFGISALPASAAGKLAEVLVDAYHPRVLIYGTFARDYAIPVNAEDASVIVRTPWIRHRTGEIDLNGWLYDVSYGHSYKGHLRDLVALKVEEVTENNYGPPAYRAYGLDPKEDIRVDVRAAPDMNHPMNVDPVRWLQSYQILPENVAGLSQVLDQSEKGVQVIVLELPFYETGLAFFGNGQQDYNRYIQVVSELTAARGLPFWQAVDQVTVAPEGWWDYFHFNLSGAREFSQWLGAQLAGAYLQGSLYLPEQSEPGSGQAD
jgi:hypothetical protein